jgi:S-adenosylmethionine decarboxylase proenzyme
MRLEQGPCEGTPNTPAADGGPWRVPMSRYLGRQLVIELYACDSALLSDRAYIEAAMNDAARHCGMTIVDSVFHVFNPFGVSGAVIIAESHIAIHTWPEFRYAAVDVFTCGDSVDPSDAALFLERALRAGHASVSELNRGSTRMINPQGG